MRTTLLFFCFAIFINKIEAQSCFTISPKNYGVPCGATCTNFSFKVPALKSTDDYKIDSVNYSPLPYTTPSGIELIPLYCDDTYSSVIDLPFKVCFYGLFYDKMVIGSNGLITFDLQNANTFNGYNINTSLPSGGSGTYGGTSYYPRAAIMASFTDLDPSSTLSPIQPTSCISTTQSFASKDDRKIEWRIEGTQPCRKVVVSFYGIGVYGGGWTAGGTNCNSLNPGDYQMIINESTNDVKVNFSKKLCNASSSGSKTILGIQNWDRDKAVTAPGKNATVWTAINKSYVFTPNGTTNLLQSVTIKKKDGTLVGTGTIGATVNDSTAITYNNYCLTGAGPDTLVVSANYASCTGLPADDYSLIDTIYVIKSPADLLATATISAAICLSNTGSITVNVPTGAGTAPFQYSINGGTLQTSNTFTGLGIGTYTVFVKDATGSCTSTLTVNVGLTNPVTATGLGIAPTCVGASNGSLTVTATNATAPITYSLNAGAPQASNTFTGLAAGTYNITVKDGNGCNTSVFVTVPAGTGTISASITPTATSCPGASNASIAVNSATGTAPHQYAIGAAGAFGTANVFTGLASGNYVIKVKDANGCTVTNNVTVTNGAGITATAATTATSCAGVNNGTITVTANNGASPYEYSLNGAANVTTNIFTGLAAGANTIKVTDVNGCNVTINATITTGTGVTATTSITPTTCAGVNNGAITVNPIGGATPYSYSLDGGTPQGANSFTNVSAGAHTILVTDAVGCTRTLNINVTTGTGINATSATTATSCSAISNGTITITPSNGTAPYSYVLDGGAPQTSNVFTGVNSGSHTVVVTDFLGCNRTLNITVAAGIVFTLSQATTQTTCAAATNGTATITATGATGTVQYAIDGGANQPSNVFTSLSSGTHTVVVTDGNGCTNSITFSVAPGPGITGTAAPTATSCNGASNGQVQLLVSGSAATPLQYQINGGAYVPTNPFTGLTAGNYPFTIKDAIGCITPTINATVAAGPNLAATGVVTNVDCNGANTGSIVLTNTNGNAPYQYSINGGALQASNTFTNLSAATYTIGLTDGSGCTGTTSIMVIQPTVLNATVATNAVLCNGANDGVINLTATGGTTPYQYSINNGATFGNNANFNVAAGTYPIIVKDANNCTKTLSVTITQPTVLTLTATTTNASCNGGADGTIAATAGGGSPTYTYSIDGTTFQNGNSFNVLPGSYTVTVKDVNGCTKTFNTSVGLTSNIVVNTRPDTTICESKSVTLTTISNAISYKWRPNTSLNDSTIQNPIATPLVTTKYYVFATLGGCTAVDSVTVTVNAAPIADAGLDNTVCYGKADTLQGSGGVQFIWAPTATLNNGSISNPISTTTTTTNYWLNVIDANGCTSLVADTMLLTITPPLQAYAGPDTTVVMGQPYQLSANLLGASGTLTGLQYLWSPSFGLNNALIQSPIATITTNQNYNVEISTPEGCKGTAVVRLQVLAGPDIYVPTAFTPNGDGQNDVFKVFPVGIKQFDYLRIFNRWGQLIFETKNPSIGWNAIFKSINQPSGAYIYNVQGITDQGKKINKKGTLLIVR